MVFSLLPMAARSRKHFPGSRPDETIGKSDIVEDGWFDGACHGLLLRDDVDELPSPAEGQYDSDKPILSRKEKTGKRDSSLERVNKGIDRRARLR
jgi:hypothetical protein